MLQILAPFFFFISLYVHVDVRIYVYYYHIGDVTTSVRRDCPQTGEKFPLTTFFYSVYFALADATGVVFHVKLQYWWIIFKIFHYTYVG